MATKYAADRRDAYNDLREDGGVLSFPVTPEVYNDAENTWVKGDPTTYNTYAIQNVGTPDVLGPLGLMGQENVTLFGAAIFTDPAGVEVEFEPKSGAVFDWGGKRYTAKITADLAPDGAPIAYDVIGAR
jgi:hypothetical protein